MTRILVVGAGIAGLALAGALGDADCDIEIVERHAEIEGDGVGIVLMPNGVAALDRLGLGGAVRTRGTEIRALELERGGERLQLSLAEIWRGCTQPTIAIRRSELHRLLASRLSSPERAQVRVSAGRTVIGVESIDRRPVVRFADGTSESYDLVVGADGVRSVVRRAIHPEAEAAPTGLYYFRFLSRAWSATSADVWRSVERSDAAFGHIPVGQGRLHCFVQLRRTTMPCAAGGEDEYFRAVPCGWDETLAQAYERRCGVLRAGPAQIVNPIRWGRGACVLLGDASHALSPTLSEGGSLALEDAIVFASVLGDATDPSAAVERYANARRQRVEWAHRMAMAQLAAVARGRTQTLPRRQSAIDYMTELYRPLCADLSPASPLGRDPRYHP